MMLNEEATHTTMYIVWFQLLKFKKDKISMKWRFLIVVTEKRQMDNAWEGTKEISGDLGNVWFLELSVCIHFGMIQLIVHLRFLIKALTEMFENKLKK